MPTITLESCEITPNAISVGYSVDGKPDRRALGLGDCIGADGKPDRAAFRAALRSLLVDLLGSDIAGMVARAAAAEADRDAERADRDQARAERQAARDELRQARAERDAAIAARDAAIAERDALGTTEQAQAILAERELAAAEAAAAKAADRLTTLRARARKA